MLFNGFRYQPLLCIGAQPTSEILYNLCAARGEHSLRCHVFWAPQNEYHPECRDYSSV
jgi:hypothetical protein